MTYTKTYTSTITYTSTYTTTYTTGAVTTRLAVHDFPPVASGLSLFYIDASAHPGDMFSPVSRPACSFDVTTGVLAFLLVEIDADVKPAFANKAMYVNPS